MLAYITWESLRQAVTLGVGAGLLYVFWRCWEWRPRNWRARRELAAQHLARKREE